MRLFRKPCGSTRDVLNSSYEKNFKLPPENEYEYVRKEFGFDFVPPSQYVPSQSIDDDDDDEYDVEMNPHLRYIKAKKPVVKIMDPASDISASVADDLYIPKPPRYYEMAAVEKEKRRSRSNRQEKSYYEINPKNLDNGEDYCEHGRRRQNNLHHELKYQPKHVKEVEYRSKPKQRRSEEKSDKRVRDVGDHYARGKRPILEEEESGPEDDLGIDRVHTAYSYNSEDSAESAIEERSRGSRYSAPLHMKQAGKNDLRPTSKTKAIKQKRNKDPPGEERGYHITRKNIKYDNDNAGLVGYRPKKLVASDLEDFEKPRYDRKRVNSKERRDDQAYDRGQRRIIEEEGVMYDDHDDEERESIPRRRPSTRRKSERVRYYDDESVEIEYRIPPDQQIARKSLTPVYEEPFDSPGPGFHRRRREETDESYYTTSSGGVAADFDSGELQRGISPERLLRKKSSKGFLGRIRDSVRDSVRGSTRRENAKVLSETDNIRLDGQRQSRTHREAKSVEELLRNQSALFAASPTSAQSDGSYENEKNSDIPRSLPTSKVVPRPSHRRYAYSEQQRNDYDGHASEVQRRIRYLPENHVRHRRHRLGQESPEYDKVYEETKRNKSLYVDVPEDVYKERSFENDAQRRRPAKRHSSSKAVPFESFRTEAPVLRANPDRRRRYNVPLKQSTSRYYYDDEDHYKHTTATLNSPKLVRKHPRIRDSVHPNKNFKVGCY